MAETDGNGAGVVAVRTEVAREFLIDGLFDDVTRRYPGDLPPEIAAAIEATPEAVLDAEAADRPDRELAARVARSGYLARCVETDRFARAREPFPELVEMLAEHRRGEGASWIAATGGLSAELARREPAGKPAPGDERATSWRVPGPGGHVRHFVALHTIRHELDRTSGAVPVLLEGEDLKRCWMYGFYLRCCEEIAST